MHAEMNLAVYGNSRVSAVFECVIGTQSPFRNMANKNMHGLLISLGEHENRFFHIFLCIKKHISHLCIGGALTSMLDNQLSVFDFVIHK